MFAARMDGQQSNIDFLNIFIKYILWIFKKIYIWRVGRGFARQTAKNKNIL